MVLRLITPQERLTLDRHVVHRGAAGVMHHGAVIAHLRQVLTYFAVKGYGKFYIGITNDLNVRLSQHQRNKPEFELMCPIYGEEPNLVENAFDRLEREAIKQFFAGIKIPNTDKVMRCCNGPRGALPKTWLYILVGGRLEEER